MSRPFFEDSSASRILTPDRKIKRALKHFRAQFDWFAVYCDGVCKARCETRESARVHKAFLEMETGKPVVIKGEYDKFMFDSLDYPFGFTINRR